MQEIKDDVAVVDADGVIIVAVGSGSYHEVTLRCENPDLLRKVRAAADLGQMVEIVPLARPFQAGWDNSLGIVAAMMSAVPGRTVLLEAPKSTVRKILDVSSPILDSHCVY